MSPALTVSPMNIEYWMNGYWMNNEYWFYTQHVTGFDSVDDESKPENAMFDSEVATPDR